MSFIPDEKPTIFYSSKDKNSFTDRVTDIEKRLERQSKDVPEANMAEVCKGNAID